MNLPKITITGPDGSGKSTVTQALMVEFKKKYGDGSIDCANIWDSMIMTGAFQKDSVIRYLGSLDGTARTLFLFHAMKHSIDLALKKSPQLLLIDSHFYKYGVSELAYGTPWNIIQGAAVGFDSPSLTFFLEVDAEVSLKRKSEVSQYESGQAGQNQSEKFVKFQKSMTTYWSKMEKEFGPWIHVSSHNPVEKIVSQILTEIEKSGVCASMQSS